MAEELKVYLTEYWDGAKECRMGGPDIRAKSWEEADKKAAGMDYRLRVIGILEREIEIYLN